MATSRSRTRRKAPRKSADEASQVLRQFRQVFNAVKRHFQQVERSTGFGGAQIWALSVIAAQPAVGINGLAGAMDIHQTTASNLVKALLAANLIESSRGQADRRTVALRILPLGRKVLRRAPAPFTGVLPEAIARLDRRALGRLRKDLAALIRVLEADPRTGRTLLQL